MCCKEIKTPPQMELRYPALLQSPSTLTCCNRHSQRAHAKWNCFCEFSWTPVMDPGPVSVLNGGEYIVSNQFIVAPFDHETHLAKANSL